MSAKSPNDIDRQIGLRIRLRRTMIGMSQERLGEVLGLSFQQVQKYEKGLNRVGAGRLQDIANALEVPTSYFFDGPSEISGSSEEAAALHAFLSSTEGMELAISFIKIKNPAMRRALVNLAKAAEEEQ